MTARKRTQDVEQKLPPVAPCVVCHERRVTMVAFQCRDGSIAWYCGRHYISEDG